MITNASGQPGNGTELVVLYQVPPYMVILLSICYGSISVLATAGNGLVIWVIVGSRRMRNVTNCYIANLALADFLLALFAIPFEVRYLTALISRVFQVRDSFPSIRKKATYSDYVCICLPAHTFEGAKIMYRMNGDFTVLLKDRLVELFGNH